MSDPRPYVTFQSTAFNTSVSKEHYEHEDNFGDDLAEWIAEALSRADWEVGDEIFQEEHGWSISFGRDHDNYDLMVTCLVPERGRWLLWLESSVGFFQNLFGGKRRGPSMSAVAAVHEVLASSPEIGSILWHDRDAFRRGDLEEGAPTPSDASLI